MPRIIIVSEEWKRENREELMRRAAWALLDTADGMKRMEQAAHRAALAVERALAGLRGTAGMEVD